MPIKSLPKEKLPASVEEEQHASEHESGGADPLSIANLANVLGVSEIKMDIAANLTAGTADRLCIETDTGRVLLDNGTNFVEVGLSESQIALANLASHAHADLTGITATNHHDPTTQDVDSVDGYDITKNGAGGTGIINFNT